MFNELTATPDKEQMFLVSGGYPCQCGMIVENTPCLEDGFKSMVKAHIHRGPKCKNYAAILFFHSLMNINKPGPLLLEKKVDIL